MDLGNFRVQKFDAEGNFLLMFGGKVNKTTNGNICTAASGNTCGEGEVGTGPGEFSIENVGGVKGDFVTVDPDDTVYVGDKDRIQAFETSGAFKSSFDLPESGNPGALAVDPVSGDLYFAFNQQILSTPPGLYRLSPTGVEKGICLAGEQVTAVTVAPDGTIYAASPLSSPRIVRMKSDCTPTGEFDAVEDNTRIRGLEWGTVTPGGGIDVYASHFEPPAAYVRIYGAVPDETVVGPPPSVPPEITSQFASSVTYEEATLRAEINPFFWKDARYYLEYGAVECETGPCTQVPVPPGDLLTSQVTNKPVRTAPILLEDLEPGTTYHYRFIASSGGGGPVEGVDRTFKTLPTPGIIPPCPNDPFRTGFAATLPDCRAYEMTSPVDKNNADIATLCNSPSIPARRIQAAPDGNALTYSAYKAFGNAISSPYSSQYLPEREAGGWPADGESISPPRKGPTLNVSEGLDAQFKAFTSDLCSGWFIQDTDLQLDPAAVPGYANLYKASLCGPEPSYEAITRVVPPNRNAGSFFVELQGFSADGSTTVFRANDKLTNNAVTPPNDEIPQVYQYFEGQLRTVCVLPNNTRIAGCSAGTAAGKVFGAEHRGSLQNAVSEDGTRVWWTASEQGSGKLYVRVNSVNTIAVSKTTAAYFLGAAADGSKAFFREEGKLWEFEPGVDAPETPQLVAEGLVGGIVGMSEDASRLYFVSTKDLEGEAVEGEPNLYLYEGGAAEFIATLSDSDFETPIFSTSVEAYQHAARVNDSGSAVVFLSNNGLTGQDSIDQKTGKPVSQVYLYDAEADELVCASCNKTGARPLGGDIDIVRPEIRNTMLVAGVIPTTESQLYFSQILSEDGKRVFFESFDALLPADTNGALDVYQWEAEGKGSCSEEGGCVALISSGQSPEPSEIVDADSDGSDVFFTTQTSLLPQDPGLIDIYDARIEGGFPPPPPPPVPCVGEACQNPVPAPDDPTPGSSEFVGPANPPAPPKKCPKGKKKVKKAGKVKCVKKKKGKAKKGKGKAKKSGRAGR